MKKLSVIVPIYNQEKYLEQCLESIRMQDFNDMEVLLIDDGSMDGSARIGRDFAQRDARFLYFHQANRGLGEARNTGLDRAKGDYVLFVDSDDMLAGNYTKSLVEYMEKNSLDLLYFDEVVCGEDLGNKRISPTYPKMQPVIRRADALEYCMQPSHICARMYCKKLFSDVKFAAMWYEDMECFPKLVCNAEKIGYYKIPFYYYRQHGQAITHNAADRRNLDVIRAWNSAFRLMQELHSEEEKAALQSAVVKSVSTFLFFRQNYAKEILRWYCDTLEGHAPAGTAEVKEWFGADYPMRQQAHYLGMENEINWMDHIAALYESGGEYCSGGEIGFEEEAELLVLQDAGMKLYGIRVRAYSPVMGEINCRMRQQNLVALNTAIKDNLLEQIVIEAFMKYGRPIRMARRGG